MQQVFVLLTLESTNSNNRFLVIVEEIETQTIDRAAAAAAKVIEEPLVIVSSIQAGGNHCQHLSGDRRWIRPVEEPTGTIL